ncbi:MAG TPA: GNAT family N-acetyltransferase [Mycobacteriales bacterium]|nr:GNAT family N-acetyltransferase [Mycobacteriales bacterium]
MELARGLDGRALRALAELEQRTIAVDGGRLKLEWSVLNTRAGVEVEDILWWEGDRLLGFLGLYSFGAPTVELGGMVDPAARRQGIASRLLDAALALCRERRYTSALLVTAGATDAGRCFALGRGGRLHHSEHALVLLDEPTDGPTNPQVGLRRATESDADVVASLLADPFGSHPSAVVATLRSASSRTWIVTAAGRPVGTLRLERDGDTGAVYGFAVDPAYQGRGIGRDVLRRVCRMMRDEGATRIALEVEVDNERALNLYTSMGFVEVTTEHYYSLTL